MPMVIRGSDMKLNNWKFIGDCDEIQYYFKSIINSNMRMETSIPNSGNKYKWLVRIQLDMKNFERGGNYDYEFSFDTWNDVVELVDNHNDLFFGRKNNEHNGCIVPKYDHPLDMKTVLSERANNVTNITVQNKVPNTTIEIYRDIKNNSPKEDIDIIISEIVENMQEPMKTNCYMGKRK
jgi:hypothetical protein